MAIPTQVIAQRDFSAGELIETAMRRDDTEVLRAGARVLRNARPANTGAAIERFGRVARFVSGGERVELLRLGTLERFKFIFGHNNLVIRDENDVQVYSAGGQPWTGANVASLTIAVVERDVYIAGVEAFRPRIASLSTAGVWTINTFAFTETRAGAYQAAFRRFGATGITLAPSALTGAINVTFSAPTLVAAHVGTVFRYAGKQLRITGVTNSTSGTATVMEPLPDSWTLTVASSAYIALGDIVEGSVTGAKGEVIAIVGSDILVIVKLKTGSGFTTADTLLAPSARTSITAVTPGITPPAATTEWDEQLFSDARGWPTIVRYEFGRLIFAGFAQSPDFVALSSLRAPTDFKAGSGADDAIVERLPHAVDVTDVCGGADLFVFSDKGVYYVPISEANPLRPGSAVFKAISREGAARVPVMLTGEGILYVNSGRNRVMALVGTGQTAQPYIARDVSAYHSHLFTGPRCIAVSTGDGVIPEQYVYVVNDDGSVCVGKMAPGREWVGWFPWDGAGYVKWVSAEQTDVMFTVQYLHGAGEKIIAEELADHTILDAQVPYNTIPPALAPAPGFGPLWFFAGHRVALAQGYRDLGDRDVDALGNIVFLSGDDPMMTNLVVGRRWSFVLEPFVPHAQPGQSVRQRMRPRRIVRTSVTVQNAMGFTWDGQEIDAYEWGDDRTLQPIPREKTYRFRRLGRESDPRMQFARARPGPITVLEIAFEVTV